VTSAAAERRTRDGGGSRRPAADAAPRAVEGASQGFDANSVNRLVAWPTTMSTGATSFSSDPAAPRTA
jgi:hypothetical protein